MYEDNADLAFFYPKEGTNIYVDAMCVPKKSQNQELAMRYINFMCERDNAVANALYTYYASPLKTVIEDPEYQAEMALVHPDAMDILYGEHEMERAPQAYLNLPADKLVMLNSLWEELKVESSIGAGIYIGCGIVIGSLLLLGTYQILKKRRWAKLYD